MIDFVEPPKLWIPERPAIIRPGIDLARYFPVDFDRHTRRAIVAELVKAGRVEKGAIPLGMFAAAPVSGGPSPLIQGTVAQTGTGSGTSNSATSMVLTLPTGIVAGELLVLFVSTAAARTVTAPVGWTVSLAVNAGGGGTERQLVILTRTADGSEGATATGSQNSASSFSALGHRVNNWTAFEVSTGAVGTSTGPDPDTIAPSWGSGVNSLVFAAASSRGTNTTAQPAGYGGFATYRSSNVVASVASLIMATASENPGPFTMSPSDNWAAASMAVR